MAKDLYADYRQRGYVILRSAFEPQCVKQLLNLCERVHAQWRHNPLTNNPPVNSSATYMRHLNHPDYHHDRPEDLSFLLDICAAPILLDTLATVLNESFLFMNISFYFNPTGSNLDGNWHKDKGDNLDDPRDWATGPGVQLQVALVPSDDLELVPESHSRDYTDAERHICIDGGEKNNRSNNMPGAIRLSLDPGDAVLFNPSGIHRGRYHSDKKRRTFMISYIKERLARQTLSAQGTNQYTNQPWFLHPDYLNGIQPRTKNFFHQYINFYGANWQAKISEMNKYTSLIRMLDQSRCANPFFEKRAPG